MLTLGQVKNSSVASIAGVNVGDPQFTTYVNDAVRQLMDLGNGGSRGWWGTVQAINGTAVDGCFVWPANVQTVLGIECLKGVMPIKNFWYDFAPLDDNHRNWARHWNDKPAVVFSGTTCLFKSISNTPTKIKVIADNSQDNGKTITIYGTDSNGVEVYSLRADGTTQRGLLLTIGSSTGGDITASVMSQVTEIQKDLTISRLRLYAYNATDGIGDLLAEFAAGDVNPKFLYSRVMGPIYFQPITALVKIGFSGVTQDADIIVLDNVDAIKSMVQSIRSREAGKYETADQQEKDALRRLVAQVNSRFPLEQFVVNFKPFGTDDFRRVTMGNI